MLNDILMFLEVLFSLLSVRRHSLELPEVGGATKPYAHLLSCSAFRDE